MTYHPIKKNKRCLSNFLGDLSNMKTLPKCGQVLGRLRTLQRCHNGVQINAVRVMLAKEIGNSWTNQDMPVQSNTSIITKIRRLCSKKSINENELFDILPSNPSFKTQEEKDYYECQKQGIGYCSSTSVKYNIHPSKRVTKTEVHVESSPDTSESSESESESKSESVGSLWNEVPTLSNPAIRTSLAKEVRESANLSLSQTIKVFEILFRKLGYEALRPPSRVALQKACYKQIKRTTFPAENKTNILSFDGKTFKNLYGSKTHLLAICYDGKLIALRNAPKKDSKTVSETIISVMKDNNLNPKVCICDTEPTNCGKKNGVIVRLQREFPAMIFEACRLHVLDLILKHEMQAYFSAVSASPDLCCPFVIQLQSKWKQYKNDYNKMSNCEIPNKFYQDLPDIEKRRSDYRLLLELVIALRYKRETGLSAEIKLPNNPPSICQSRWNSRAIYSIMAETVGIDDENIRSLNTFIIYIWAKAWFGVRYCINWNEILHADISQKSKAVIMKNIKHFTDENPFTNEAAERVFRMVEEKRDHCKSVNKLETTMIAYFNDNMARLN